MARAGATRAQARGVTDLAIGSSDWLGSGRRLSATEISDLKYSTLGETGR